ncbi:MAG: hypothetical protein ACRC1H_17120 [Caldilineaceae bacterium]
MSTPAANRAPQPTPPLPLTRKAFFDLALELRQWAAELARLDPRHIHLKECHRFNAWLKEQRRYAPLQVQLAAMKPARPVARWQVLTLLMLAWAIVILLLMGRVDRLVIIVLLNGAALTLLASLMAPASVFGTTVEEIEGKLLRVVTVLDELLAQNAPGFSEGAFFQVREHLQAARRELREQIDLAHRE